MKTLLSVLKFIINEVFVFTGCVALAFAWFVPSIPWEIKMTIASGGLYLIVSIIRDRK
jgi:hypothetical protein